MGGMQELADDGVVSRGRGRPRNPEKDDAIREAAWALLAEVGYEGLTFEAVAERAGCTRATLYRRFASKIELIGSIMYDTSRNVEPVISTDMSPRDALFAHTNAFIEFMAGERGKGMLSIGEAVRRYPDLRAVTEKHKLHEREYYFDVFRRINPGCSLPHMEFVFDLLVGIVTHLSRMGSRELSRQQRDDIIDSVIFLLCRASDPSVYGSSSSLRSSTT